MPAWRTPFIAAVSAIALSAGAGPAGADPAGAADRQPLDLSALTAPGAVTDPAAVRELLDNELLQEGDLGRLVDPTRLGSVHGLGTGSPDGDDKTREYVVPAPFGAVPVLPESIAFDRRSGDYFVSSFGTGAVYRGSLDGDTVEPFLPALQGDRPSALGIETDGRGLLYVLAPVQGTVQVYDIDSGRRVAEFRTGVGGVLNDLVVTPRGDVYVTDSLRPKLFRITAESVKANDGRVTSLPLGPEVQYTVGDQINGAFNGGGIVALDDDDLILSQINTDEFFRVHVSGDGTTADVHELDVAGDVANPDGLELIDDRLFVVDNLREQVVGIELTADRASGRVVSRQRDATFASPTGIASTGKRLLITNSKIFRIPMIPPFTVSSIPIPSR